MTEEWRSVPGLDDYEISSLGRMRSNKRTGRKTNAIGGLIAPRRKYIDGILNRLEVRPYQSGKKLCFGVHQLVLSAFIGPCPAGMEGCHNDGDPSNNCLSNLRWDRHISNVADTRNHGRLAHGESNGRAVLTFNDVRSLRVEHKNGSGVTALGRKYGINRSQVYRIVKHENWR